MLMQATCRHRLRSVLTQCIEQPALRPSGAVLLPLATWLRAFTTSHRAQNWLMPNVKLRGKMFKGQPRTRTGGSTKGTTVVFGEYGMRMKDHERRMSAKQLKNGEDVIRRRMRGLNFRLFPRVHCNRAIFTKGNESRQGTGKGTFDHWAAQVSVNHIIFEMTSDAHEKVIRDAFRLAAHKMPGTYEFVKKGHTSNMPIMGITQLSNGVTEADLRRPRKKLPADEKADRLPIRGSEP